MSTASAWAIAGSTGSTWSPTDASPTAPCPTSATAPSTTWARFSKPIRTELQPELAKRMTRVPVVPELSRRATLNVNTVSGGQVGEDVQSPCVADRAHAIFDRRFLLEEGLRRHQGRDPEAPRVGESPRSRPSLRPLRSHGRASERHSGRLAGDPLAPGRHLARPAQGSSDHRQPREPTIRSTSTASATSRTPWPTARVFSTSLTSPTSG